MTEPTFKWVSLLIARTKLKDRAKNFKSSRVLPNPLKMFFSGKWKCTLLCLFPDSI